MEEEEISKSLAVKCDKEGGHYRPRTFCRTQPPGQKFFNKGANQNHLGMEKKNFKKYSPEL